MGAKSVQARVGVDFGAACGRTSQQRHHFDLLPVQYTSFSAYSSLISCKSIRCDNISRHFERILCETHIMLENALRFNSEPCRNYSKMIMMLP